ncbi:hypothetical protein M6D93_00445 [Jatrophihabitans telluris]|uniref:ABC transporter permease n=1 Tax=Jatrophihabitans telluris TaxID=2038343 RepID=A0ABY4QY54_9ACTN|nr:hypothetical protein [Jatrophihabitans telluris]UQX88489.1 hypothetical protein M6D93_00445 [Jatrophihabitans telluris]
MRAAVGLEWSLLLRRGVWVWPIALYALALIGIGALAVGPEHWAYRLVTPALVLISGWLGWLIGSATPSSAWRVAVVALGGLERALAARWLAGIGASALPLIGAWIAVEVGHSSASAGGGLWWPGIWLQLVAAIFGTSVGLWLGFTVTEEAGQPVEPSVATAWACGGIAAAGVFALVPYIGILTAFLFVLATVVAAVLALHTPA